MYDGIVNANVLDRFRPIVKDALTRVVREIVRRSITAMEKEAAQPVKSALDQHKQPSHNAKDSVPTEAEVALPEEENSEANLTRIVTTEQELAVYGIVKEMFEKSPYNGITVTDAATRKKVPVVLTYKDTVRYFGVYFNKPSWWILRLCLEGRTKWIGFDIGESEGASLVPQHMTRLEPHPLAAFRVQIDSTEDVSKSSRPHSLCIRQDHCREREKVTDILEGGLIQ